METRARIAWHVRKLRSHRRLTQENLAVDAQVDRTVISDLERQKYNASIDLLDRLATAFGVDIADFFSIPDAAETKPMAMPAGRKAKVK